MVDTVGTAEMGRIIIGTYSREMMDMMLTVRDDTVDLLPVVAMALIGIMMRRTGVFKVRPVILLKVLPDPEIGSEEDIVAVGEGDAHHCPDTTHRHHRLLWS